MKKLFFIQADNRYNKFLLKKINGKEIIKYTIDQICKINNINHIILSTYKCEQNEIFSDLSNYNCKVKVEYSNNENLSKRLVECAETYDDNIIIRVLGEQCFFDYKKVNEIINRFENEKLDFYYPMENNGILVDCIKRETILKNKELIISKDRYYKAFLEDLIKCNTIKEYKKDIPNNLYINDELSFYIGKEIINNGINNIYETVRNLNDKLLYKMLDKGSYFNKVGYIKSILEEKIINDEGEIPWLPYGIINILESRINKDMVIFEYGSGNSTMWWNKYVKKVISVEHDKKWYDILKNSNKCNLKNLIYAPLENSDEYEKSILRTDSIYDIIIIDGRKRVKCSKVCLESLKDNGIIIWDDSYREYYKEGFQYLKEKGFKEFIVNGIGANGSGERQTSIFYRKDNCLNI
ncbi:hypothetical protein AB2063_000831 [Clostridium botulinum]